MTNHRDELWIVATNFRAREERIGEVWMSCGFVSFLIGLCMPPGEWQTLLGLGGIAATGLGFLVWCFGKIKTHLKKP